MPFGRILVVLALFVTPAIADDVIIKSPNMSPEPQYEARPLSPSAAEDRKAVDRKESTAKPEVLKSDHPAAAQPEKPM